MSNSARFVVGTGRCGSTLLSELLAAHPGVLSVSELFSALQPGAFPGGAVDGPRFWELLSSPRSEWTAVLRDRREPRELLYPVDAGGRFSRAGGVAPVAAVCLPALTRSPDALFSELSDVVPAWPPAPVGDQYRRLFAWLCSRLGRQAWVERSGGSLSYARSLVGAFPGARFVHLYRDGCECALSMSRHPFFEQPGWSLERYGRRWSALILNGVGALGGASVLHVPVTGLASALPRVVAFLDLPSPPAGWLSWARGRIVAPPSRVVSLPARELAALRRACEPGEARLRELAG